MRIDLLSDMTVARLAVIATDATLQAAAVALSDPRVGLVVVCDESGVVAGVVSKSDIVRHLALSETAKELVMARMSRNIVSCRPEDDLYETWKVMSARGLQNIPVLNADSKPIGILDIRDALKMLLEQEQYEEQQLINYVAGVGYQ
jgi:CBS domain-containing protein